MGEAGKRKWAARSIATKLQHNICIKASMDRCVKGRSKMR